MTVPTVPDPVADIISLLLDDDTVSSLVDDRVGREIPEGDGDLMPRAAVVVSAAGGPGRPGTVKYRRTRVDTTCYGATLGESAGLHRAVREALETMNRPSGSLFSIETSSDGANARDPVKQWPTCYASYLVLSATTA